MARVRECRNDTAQIVLNTADPATAPIDYGDSQSLTPWDLAPREIGRNHMCPGNWGILCPLKGSGYSLAFRVITNWS